MRKFPLVPKTRTSIVSYITGFLDIVPTRVSVLKLKSGVPLPASQWNPSTFNGGLLIDNLDLKILTSIFQLPPDSGVIYDLG